MVTKLDEVHLGSIAEGRAVLLCSVLILLRSIAGIQPREGVGVFSIVLLIISHFFVAGVPGDTAAGLFSFRGGAPVGRIALGEGLDQGSCPFRSHKIEYSNHD